jgi:hypothetical protein
MRDAWYAGVRLVCLHEAEISDIAVVGRFPRANTAEITFLTVENVACLLFTAFEHIAYVTEV